MWKQHRIRINLNIDIFVCRQFSLYSLSSEIRLSIFVSTQTEDTRVFRASAQTRVSHTRMHALERTGERGVDQVAQTRVMSDKWRTVVRRFPCGPARWGRNYFKDTSATRCRKLKRNDGREAASFLPPVHSSFPSSSSYPLLAPTYVASWDFPETRLVGRSGKGQTLVGEEGISAVLVIHERSMNVPARWECFFFSRG